MATLYFDTKNALFLVNGAVTEKICGKKGDTVEVFCQPEGRKKECFAPIYSKIFIGDTLHLNSELLYFADCGGGSFIIGARKTRLASAAGLEIVAQQRYSFSKNHTATVYNDFEGHICIETDEFFYAAQCPPVASAEIRADLSGVDLFVISAVLSDGKKAVVIVSFDVDYKELLNITADEIVFEENGVLAIKKSADMRGRTISELYRYEDNSYIAEEISVETNGKSFAPELLPYAFLEAVAAGDDAGARELLCADLQNPVAAYREYFGNFEICEAGFPEYEPYVVPLILPERDNFALKRYKFTVSDGLIRDIKPI